MHNGQYMKSIYLTFSIFILLIFTPLFAQSKAEIKELFSEAESYFLFEEYNEALPIYQDLLRLFPNNNKLNYRIGICYLNTPGQKELSINYLEKAITDINPKYKERSIKETGAPMDAYFYLGNAYRVNNKLEKAIETYTYFKENLDEKVYEIHIVEHEIRTCHNAIKLQKTPLYISYTNLGGTINTRRSDILPVVSGDEQTLVYTQKLAFYDAVFFSEKVNGKWTNPINLTPDFHIDQDFYSSSLSYDGKTLYLYKNDDYDGNIYTSKYVEGRWQPVEKLNDNINTKYWESHACETKDGKSLYFTSNRKDGHGGLDIYKSVKDSLGQWGAAMNLGPNINTEYNEETPFISEDGKTLYFSSYGHFNIGGYDIFYSSLFENNEWSTPLNMGYPINTPDNDLFYQPVGEGNYAYYSMFSESGFGDMDIFRLAIYTAEHPRKFLIRGIVSLGAVPVDLLTGVNIHVIESIRKDTTAVLNPNSQGEYSILVDAGEYDLSFEGEGFETTIQHISLPLYLEDSVVVLSETFLTLLDVSADLQLMDSIYTFEDDTIDIALRVEPGATLLVESFQDTSLSLSQEFLMKDSLYTYRYKTIEGENRLQFTLTDKYGNTETRSLDFFVPVSVPILAVIEEKEQKDMLTTFMPGEEVIAFRNRLSHYADGDLKTTIDEIDLAENEISSTDMFVATLLDQADQHDYTKEDVHNLLFLTAARNNRNLHYFHKNFKDNSSGELKTLLDTLQLDQHNITNINDLNNYLAALEAGIISDKELQDALSKMAAEEDQKLAAMRRNLDSLAQGDLKEVLQELEPEKEKIYSTYELISFLIENAAILGYTEEELALLLAKLAGNGNPDVEMFLSRMLASAQDGNLKSALGILDFKKEKINSISDLIQYLLDHKEELGFSSADLMNLLIDIISETDIDLSKVKELIQEEEDTGMSTAGKLGIFVLIAFATSTIIFLVWKRKKKEKE